MRYFLALLFGALLLGECSKALSQTYVTMSVASYHLDRETPRNERNWGLGFEQEVAKDVRFAAGMYRNSSRIDSTYLGVSWTPWRAGDFKFGGFLGGFTGYAIDAKYGLLPVVTYERGKWGANLTLAPTQGGEKQSGVFGLQLKYQLK